MKFIENWKEAHRWWSVRFAGLGGVVLTTWLALPEDWKAPVPDWFKMTCAYGALAGAVILRLLKQEPKAK